MNRSEFLLQLKEAFTSGEGCTTKTTPKKGEGYIPYNRHTIKWGQVDADQRGVIRIVIDLSSLSFDEEAFARKTGLSVRPPRKSTVGYRYTAAESPGKHDQLILHLSDSFIETHAEEVEAILRFTRESAAQSGFKSKASI